MMYIDYLPAYFYKPAILPFIAAQLDDKNYADEPRNFLF